MPLTLSIKTNDRINLSFLGVAGGFQIISNVVKSVVNGANNYAVTVPTGTYNCSPNNTTIYQKSIVGVDLWVLGA